MRASARVDCGDTVLVVVRDPELKSILTFPDFAKRIIR
jgi:hypothetical protein